MSSADTQAILFPNSPVTPNPLGEGKKIKTAAALMIGDEILNGKTRDTNSNFFAKYCFELGIELKRIEVIADDEDEIVEAARRMVAKYDFVVTSGGIGPTHDDITYASLAKAFNQPLKHHEETLKRLAAHSKKRKDVQNATPEQKVARERMALFPANAEVLFVEQAMWVPVCRLEGKLCIFPGIPSLFQRMLAALTPYLPLPDTRPFRHLIHTTLPESSIAPYLTSLHERLKSDGIRVGSYPILQRGVTVSLIGDDETKIREIGEEVVREIQGKVVDNTDPKTE
ncbi:Molybdopterin binding protein [Hysterangium stoloniferum]|nr:Molybdopterin binding protein [Hysterangium stoloniferum]